MLTKQQSKMLLLHCKNAVISLQECRHFTARMLLFHRKNAITSLQERCHFITKTLPLHYMALDYQNAAIGKGKDVEGAKTEPNYENDIENEED